MSDIGSVPHAAGAAGLPHCSEDVVGRVRALLTEYGRLTVAVTDLTNDSDLFLAGLTSLATVNLMLAIEEAFDIEFPDAMLSRRSFESITTLSRVVSHLCEVGVQ